MSNARSELSGVLPLGLLWFFALGSLGLFLPYYSLFLRDGAGLSESEIGIVLSMLPLVGVPMQLFWGHLSDRSGMRRGILVVLGLGAAVSYWFLGFAETFLAFTLGTALSAAFSRPQIPMTVGATLAVLPSAADNRFGIVRAGGTLGFLIMVTGLPAVLLWSEGSNWFSSRLEVYFWSLLLVSLLSGLAALSLPSTKLTGNRSRRGDLRALLSHRPILYFMGFLFFAHLFIQGPIHLVALLITEKGGELSHVSQMWIWMLVIEIGLLLRFRWLVMRLGRAKLLCVGLIVEGARWAMCGLVDSLSVVLVLQALHGFGVVGLLVGAPVYLDAAVPARLRSTAQALVAISGPGAGSLASTLVGGYLIESVGVSAYYALMGFGSLVVAGAGFAWLRAPEEIALPAPDSSLAAGKDKA